MGWFLGLIPLSGAVSEEKRSRKTTPKPKWAVRVLYVRRRAWHGSGNRPASYNYDLMMKAQHPTCQGGFP